MKSNAHPFPCGRLNPLSLGSAPVSTLRFDFFAQTVPPMKDVGPDQRHLLLVQDRVELRHPALDTTPLKDDRFVVLVDPRSGLAQICDHAATRRAISVANQAVAV